MNTIIDRTDGSCMQLQCRNHCPLNCNFDRIKKQEANRP